MGMRLCASLRKAGDLRGVYVIAFDAYSRLHEIHTHPETHAAKANKTYLFGHLLPSLR